MKAMIKKIGTLGIALLLAVSVCGAVSAQAATAKSSAKATYDDAGYYTLIRMIEEGEEFDISVLNSFGMYGGLVLEEDGTGFIFITDEVSDVSWKDGSITADGETIKYTFNSDGDMVLEQDGVSLYFSESSSSAPTKEEVLAGEIQTGTEPDGTEYSTKRDVVIVGGTYELFDEIADNKCILLMPGTYNITEFIEANDADLEKWNWEDEEFFGYGVYQDEVYDGKQLIIGNVDNLTIMSVDPDDPAEIIVEPRYAHVLTFYDCDNLEVDDIVIGHTETGDCRGNVFDLILCDNVEMNNVDAYGCGVIALSAESCDDIRLNKCYFHDCYDGIIRAENTSNLVAKYCKFANVESWGIIAAENSDIKLIGCSFRKLSGGLISAYSGSDVNLFFPNMDKTSRAALEDSFDGETAECLTVVTEDDVPKG